MEIFMANGPLGGNMGTPPVPPQPPQVSFETTAQSRGNFNNFLKSIPNTTSMTPIPPLGSAPTAPMSNPMGNIDIFNQPPSMGMGMMGMNQPPMNPMMQQPMQPPTMSGVMGTPVQNFFFGGGVDDFSDFGGFDNPSDPFGGGGFSDDAQATDSGGSGNNFDDGFTEEEDESRAGDYQTDDSGVFTGYGGDDSSPQVVDTRPVTNITNVGAGSNLRYDPQFTANQLQSRGLDPRGFMSDENFAQTTQGVQAQAQAQRDAELAEANRLSGRSLPVMGDLGASRNIAGAIAPAQITTRDVTGVTPTQLDFGLGLALDDPFGLGFNTAGLIESRRDVQRIRDPQEFVQEARLPTVAQTVIPGAGGVDERPTGFVEDDLIGAIIGGRSDLYSPFTNNPGNLKQAREDLTTETIKSVDPITGDITTGPALFNTLEAGQQALDRQLSLYGDRSINTPEKFVETYLGTDTRENPLENKQGYITAVRNAVGDNFDLSNPTTRDNITKAITRQELGQKGIDALKDQVTAATGLEEVFNTPITSAGANVRQAQTTLSPPPIGFEEPVGVEGGGFGTFGFDSTGRPLLGRELEPIRFGIQGITPKEQRELRELRQIDDDEFNPRVLEASARGSRLGEALANDFLNASRMPGTAVSDFLNPATVTQNISPENTAARIARNNRTINEIRADLGSRVPDTALENLSGRRDILPDTLYDIDTRDTRNFVGDDFAPALDLVDARQKQLAERDAIIRDMDDIDRATAGRASDFPTLPTVPEDFEENVGKAFDAKRMAEIERLYGEDVGQTKPGRGSDPTFFEGLGVPGIGTTVGDFIERKSRENMATEVALGRPMTLGETLFGFDANPATTMEEYTKRTGRKIPESQLVRNESGRIIAIKDEFGRVVSGVDPNAPIQSGDDSDDPILIKRPPKKDPEPEDKDKTPNVFGGQTRTTEPKSVVVDSPFTANIGDYSPVGFDSGDLNKLIESITGIASPRRMEKGGVAGYAEGGRVMQALDNLLATA